MRAVGWLFLPLDAEVYQQSQDAARTLLDDQAWQHGYERGQRSISAPEPLRDTTQSDQKATRR